MLVSSWALMRGLVILENLVSCFSSQDSDYILRSLQERGAKSTTIVKAGLHRIPFAPSCKNKILHLLVNSFFPYPSVFPPNMYYLSHSGGGLWQYSVPIAFLCSNFLLPLTIDLLTFPAYCDPHQVTADVRADKLSAPT